MSPKMRLAKSNSAEAARQGDLDIARRGSATRLVLTHWLPVVVYGLLIFIQSSLPSPSQMPDIRHIDKLLHLAAYTVMGFLFYRALSTTRLNRRTKWMILMSALLSVLSGIGDEVHQYFVPARDADVIDFWADVAGSILGALTGFVVYHYHRPKRQPVNSSLKADHAPGRERMD